MTDNDDGARRQSEARRREALQAALAQAGLTPAAAARLAGMSTANALYNFMTGRSKQLSSATYEKLARGIPGATVANLLGIEAPAAIHPPGMPVTVRAIAMAGLAQASFDIAPPRQRILTFPLPLEMAGVFGVEVREPGAEKIYPAGTVLVCQPPNAYTGTLHSGLRLVVQAAYDRHVQVTVRELEMQANEAWLWMRSSHPACQVPVRMPYVPGARLREWRAEGTRYEPAGVVTHAWIPQV